MASNLRVFVQRRLSTGFDTWNLQALSYPEFLLVRRPRDEQYQKMNLKSWWHSTPRVITGEIICISVWIQSLNSALFRVYSHEYADFRISSGRSTL
ncbi:hypothetical protein TESG_08631 [Trichophyton tonsurans CBS 112818]|uniref:Uncharacterized protein n=1 Tax=Trichophyton tonsurans (strain CBS 112818) TaxID=647933 RepID=F2S941_TRIT1|nr:hypothetical protein TESG_08631 [Trichophyton tonsurans CBS 112818]